MAVIILFINWSYLWLKKLIIKKNILLWSLKSTLMSKNLVIVESPAKAKTIEKYLGSEFKVSSSYGHISDLP